MQDEIKNIISIGENTNIEFKLASSTLPKSIFETVCAFLNTAGGYIILRVSDSKEIIGIKEENIANLKKILLLNVITVEYLAQLSFVN